MIVNIPTSDSLNDVALRLHFSAWSDLINIHSDFDQAFEPGGDPFASGTDEWSKERAGYLIACQPELQSICALIQQSNELALKAKICEVSPFLLLIKSDLKLSANLKGIAFSDFKTLDAVELPTAVNMFCKEPLSDKFIQTYNRVRSLRNKIAHLGSADKIFSPDELLHILVVQYTELWKKRGWLRDRLLFASQTRGSFFHDYKYTSPHMAVMHELPLSLDILTNSEFKKLFGHSKTTRRYFCHACIDHASTRFADLDHEMCKTAFLEQSGLSLFCAMCCQAFKIARAKCASAECKGNVIGDNADDYVGKCHSCGDFSEQS